jgi:hypothetical protein
MTKYNSKIIIQLVLVLLCTVLVQAQESSNSSGGDSKGSGGSVAYSIGQLLSTSNTSASGTISHGVQQVYEIVSVGINETNLNLSLLVFPNPTTHTLTLQVSEYEQSPLKFTLIDMRGKLLTSGQIVAHQTQIDLSTLPSASYIIRILNSEDKLVHSFNITKH